MRYDHIKMNWMESPWRNERGPSLLEMAMYGDEGLPAFEGLHACLRATEPVVEEIGYLIKRCGGKDAVHRLLSTLQVNGTKKHSPIVNMIESWVKNNVKGKSPECRASS